MALRKTYQAVKTPLTQVHVDNEALNDGSGYLGLILNKNKNGKAIRIALRDGSQRVHIMLADIPNLIAGLTELATSGVALSVDEVIYDKVIKTGVKKAKKRKAA